MGAPERICAILRGSEARRVNFQYGTARVYGTGFQEMAELVAKERIHIRLESNQARAQAMYRLGVGIYDHPANTFYIPGAEFPGPNPFDSALVIHEMTHALLDWQRVTVTELESEAAAYTAQVMWLQINSVQAGGGGTLSAQARSQVLGQLSDPAALRIFGAAWAVAQAVYTTPGGYTVHKGQETRDLERAIGGVSLYRNAHRVTISYGGH